MNNQFSGRIENPQVIEELIADKNLNKLFVFGANWCPDAMNLLQKLNDINTKKILRLLQTQIKLQPILLLQLEEDPPL